MKRSRGRRSDFDELFWGGIFRTPGGGREGNLGLREQRGTTTAEEDFVDSRR